MATMLPPMVTTEVKPELDQLSEHMQRGDSLDNFMELKEIND